MTTGDREGYVPGLKDLVNGNPDRNLLSVNEKKEKGIIARDVLHEYKKARLNKDSEKIEELKAKFRDKEFFDNYFRYFGYSYFEAPEDVMPDVPASFYSFHLMVYLGFLFILIFTLAIIFLFRGTLQKNKWFLWIAVFSIPLPFIAGESGWIVTEMGRQPWIIQDLMPVSAGVSQISSGSVVTTFILFAVLFTVLLIAEISIMLKQIKMGPKDKEDKNI
jgi:cytochrome d ubiquinol oxidase subunit I